MLNCYVWSFLLYGSEVGLSTISKTMERRLKAAEMWFLRRMLTFSWTETESSAEVLNIAGIERQFFQTCRKRQLVFWRYVIRRNGRNIRFRSLEI